MKIVFQSKSQGNKAERLLLQTATRGFLGGVFGGKQEPIKFHTSKVLPYSQEYFFNVVKDVEHYDKFIPWIN